jgi:iron complex outermembrane receptor protein
MRIGTTMWLCLCGVLTLASMASAQNDDDLRRLSLEQLMNIEVTTVARRPESAALTPAAIFVITRDDIRRAGVSSIPEALRLAPGVQVARIDANKWAIGIRGFPDRLARAMLVLIDGRAVYSPLFAGTYWEVQDMLLADVDRIEVIRGPGGTLWGANAVNGIVNIITRPAAATQGTLVSVESGSNDRLDTAVRYGGAHGERLHYRGYAKVFDRASFVRPDESDFDAWRMGQVGGRADWTAGPGRQATLQGDLYVGRAGQRATLSSYTTPYDETVSGDAALGGGNVLGRWIAGRWHAQAYYDRTSRRELTFRETRDTVDLDIQHALLQGARHHVLWGAEYRVSSGRTASSQPQFQSFDPANRTDQLATGFIQDEIDVVPRRVRATLGVKLEHNGYSGVGVQPSARLAWSPVDDHTVVVSVTRALRTPSRVETDYNRTAIVSAAVPLFIRLLPNDAFEPEDVVAYETGYRGQIGSRASVSVSTFLNRHQHLLSTEAGTPFVESDPAGLAPDRLVIPLMFGNGLHGTSYGLEANADLRPAPWLRTTASYSYLRVELTRNPGSADASQEHSGEGLSPRHQIEMQWAIDLPRAWQIDWMFRYVGRLPALNVPAYATSDVRVAYRLRPDLSLALVGRDLQQAHHLEFTNGTLGASEVPRSVSVQLVWTRE